MTHLIAEVILLAVVSASEQTRPSCQYDEDRHFLDCSSRGFPEVPSGQFPEDVRGIDLSFNNISELENQTFWNTSSMEYLDLSNNAIQIFQPESFQGLANLVCLNLSENPFNFTPTVFTQKLFQPLVNLKVIRVQGFPRSEPPRSWMGVDGAFGQLESLTTLLFHIPDEFIFGPGFADLTELATISTAGFVESDSLCRLSILSKEAFQIFENITLRELRLLNCPIYEWDWDAFDPLTSLDVLDLSYSWYLGIENALDLLQSFQGRKMSEISLKMVDSSPLGTSVVHTSKFVFLSHICVQLVDLSLNFILLKGNSDKPLFHPYCLEHLNISYHSTPYLLEKLNQSITHSYVLRSLDLSRGYSFPKSQGYAIPQQEMYSSVMPLSVPKSLIWLSFSVNGYGYNQQQLFFFIRPTNLRHLEAAYIDFYCNYIPLTTGLEQLNYLDMSGMISDDIAPDFFRYVHNVTSLRLTNTPRIGKTLQSSVELFSGLPILETIDLSSNELIDINSQIFHNNQKMRDLNLANNKLQRIPPAVSALLELQRLDMRSNFITHLSADEMILLDRWMKNAPAFKFLLGGNTLQCTCDTVMFIRWVLRRKANLDNPNNYTCFLSNGTTISVSKFGENLRDFEVKCISHTYLIIAVVGSLALIVLILVFAAIYRYRVNLRYWLYTKLQPPEDLFENHEYVYDAFVAYTSDDRDWVVNELRPHVEPNNGPTRLCIHDRDFTFGKPIHMNIVEKMAESRKILLVISHGFLESTYGPLEIEYAGMKCLDQGRDDIILCVLMEEIPVRQMPRALRNLWHKITFLTWSTDPQEQAIFWRNLKSAVCRDQV